MTHKYCIALLPLLLSSCFSNYIPYTGEQLARIKVSNDTPASSLFIATYQNPNTCDGSVFFNIPKDMQMTGSSNETTLKAQGVFETTVHAGQPFSLKFIGSGKGKTCYMITTLKPQQGYLYEYHYHESSITGTCTVYVDSVSPENVSIPAASPTFIQRRITSSKWSEECLY